MVESLIMAQQFEAAQTILQQAPELQDDDLLQHYARQAAYMEAITEIEAFPVLMLSKCIFAIARLKGRLL